MSRVRPLLLGLLCVLLLGTAGCVDLPRSGPVQAGPSAEPADQQAPFDFTPGGPKRGATPVEIVDGFFTAMQATPLTTFVARQFLTSESGNLWRPESGTVIYRTEAMTAGGGTIAVRLGGVTELDGRGSWLGDPTGGAGLTYRFRLVREKGQWRISNPPNRLIIPQAHFATRFQQYALYFFDPSAQVLVPEPVYVPNGAQAPTLLVAALLHGPDRRLAGTERTFIPPRTKLDDISVPVSRDGVADVPLSDALLDARDEALSKAVAQLAWTLGQVPGVAQVRVSVGGSPLDLPGSPADVSAGAWSEFDPAVAWASQAMFGLRNGRAVTVTDGAEHRLSGPFGARAQGLRSLDADLPGERLAGVSTDGSEVLAAPAGGTPDAPVTPVLTGGTDLLRPVHDLYGQLWLLDRTGDGAVLWVVRRGALRQVEAPGVTGTDVAAFVLSRDGTRLVVVRHERGRDRLYIARTVRDARGRVERLTAAVPLPLPGFRVTRIRDLAWRTPDSLAVLTGPIPGSSQVLVASVDGSSAQSATATDPELFRDQATRLVTSPAVGAPLYVGTTDGRLFQLAVSGRWIGTSIRPGLVSPAFVG